MAETRPDGPCQSQHAAARRHHTRRAHINGFTVSEGEHQAGSALPWHAHDNPTICYVLEGAFTEVAAGTALTCVPATLKFMPAGERHCDRFDLGRARGLLVEIAQARADTLRPYAAVLGERVHYHGGAAAAIALRLWLELSRMDEAAPLAIEGLILELLATASRCEAEVYRGRPPRWLDEAHAIVTGDLAGHQGLAELAGVVGVHPVTLARGFRRAYGCTLGEYVRRQRIENACRQLLDSAASLAEIALANGFADQSHFSNTFHRYTGMTPARYRRSAKER
jgi:AraC family transcriptional regulator